MVTLIINVDGKYKAGIIINGRPDHRIEKVMTCSERWTSICRLLVL